jgi:hypothetical protein
MGRAGVGRLSRATAARASAALPAVLLAAATVTWLAAAAFGAHPFWPSESLTLSEAAALRDGGEVARLLATGVDPNGRYSIRGGFLYKDPVVLTPVEAALAADRPEIVAILVHAGATPSATSMTQPPR